MTDGANDSADRVWYIDGNPLPIVHEDVHVGAARAASTASDSFGRGILRVGTDAGEKAAENADESMNARGLGALGMPAADMPVADVPGMQLALDDRTVFDTEQTPALFVGRKQTAAEIGALWARVQQSRARGRQLRLLVTTTQKQALRLLRAGMPLFVMLETQAKPNSRARFGRILRERRADLKLVAVGPRPAGTGFAFDDHWEPPFTDECLAALIERMQTGNDSSILQQGPLRLDISTRTVITPKGSRRMTPKQCALLHFLLDNHNRVVSRQDIMQVIWETNFMEDTRTLDVHIHWLREFIEPEPAEPIYLRTVRGKGYHLCLEG